MNEADERDAFYQAIIDNWEDDTPRLVYADWLDERGDEPSRLRAELIRAQCDPARWGLTVSEHELADRVRKHTEARGIPLGAALGEARFTRGFITDWLQNSPEVFSLGTPEAWTELGPIDEPGVYFHSSGNRKPSPEYVKLAAAPGLRYWRSINSASNAGESVIGEANFCALFGSPNLVNLRHLKIVDQTRSTIEEEQEPIGERGVKAFANNPALARLSTIKFWWVGLTDKGLKALAATKYLRSLRTLSLADRLTDTGIAALSKSPILEAVEYLHLNGTITGRAVERLVSSPRLKSLHTLDLSGYTSGAHEYDSLHFGDMSRALDPVGFRALLESPLLPRLKVLKLCPSNGDADVRQLADAADRMTALERLDLDASCMGGEITVLRRRFRGKLYFFGSCDEGR